jgi:dihydropteroate synthase
MSLSWQTSKRILRLDDRPLVMGILNVTPDSFSDGGEYCSIEASLVRAEKMIADGADIIDIGGESTRPGSSRVDAREEIKRTAPVIRAIVERFPIPMSIDTSRCETAAAAIDAGAEIINDISGLRFDARIAKIAARTECGLVLMHSRGSFETLHSQDPIPDMVTEVISGLRHSIEMARSRGVDDSQLTLDVGLGFGKTFEQNLELIAKLDKIVSSFPSFPFLIGASRKSFIGKVLDGAPVDERLYGSLAAAMACVERGARIIRVHDVKESVAALSILNAVNAIGSDGSVEEVN